MNNPFTFRTIQSKIANRQAARTCVTKWRAAGKRIVYTNGCFDLLHPGHVMTLEGARRLGDVLIVGLNSDRSAHRLKGPGRPILSARERTAMLAALECVDLVIIFSEDSSLPLLKMLRPDIWVKGGDYLIDTVNQQERAFVESYGGQVAIGERVEGVSTTELIARIKRLPD